MRVSSYTTSAARAVGVFIVLLVLADAALSQSLDNLIVEQYKAHIGDLGNVGSRYATAQAFYVSVISTLIAILTTFIAIFSIKKMGDAKLVYRNAGVLTASGCVLLFIAVICFLWYGTLDYYHDLFGAKIGLLQEMEKKHAQVLFQFFTEERNRLPKFSLTQRDELVALVIGCFTLLCGVFFLVAAGTLMFRSQRRVRSDGAVGVI